MPNSVLSIRKTSKADMDWVGPFHHSLQVFFKIHNQLVVMMLSLTHVRSNRREFIFCWSSRIWLLLLHGKTKEFCWLMKRKLTWRKRNAQNWQCSPVNPFLQTHTGIFPFLTHSTWFLQNVASLFSHSCFFVGISEKRSFLRNAGKRRTYKSTRL